MSELSVQTEHRPPVVFRNSGEPDAAKSRAPEVRPPADRVEDQSGRADASLRRFENRDGTNTAPPANNARERNGDDPRFRDAGDSIEVTRSGPREDPERLRRIRERLAQTPTGRQVLQQLDESGARVVFAPGTAYFYDPATNTITLGRDLPVDQQAIQLAHESVHAAEQQHGHTADPRQFKTADAYADAMIDEEARATVQQIRLANELGSTTYLQREYNEAYQRAYEEARARQRAQGIDDDAAARRAAEEAGFRRVVQGFNNGEVTVSFNGQHYRDYYRQGWERVRALGNK